MPSSYCREFTPPFEPSVLLSTSYSVSPFGSDSHAGDGTNESITDAGIYLMWAHFAVVQRMRKQSLPSHSHHHNRQHCDGAAQIFASRGVGKVARIVRLSDDNASRRSGRLRSLGKHDSAFSSISNTDFITGPVPAGQRGRKP
jgi:hypothetical protein